MPGQALRVHTVSPCYLNAVVKWMPCRRYMREKSHCHCYLTKAACVLSIGIVERRENCHLLASICLIRGRASLTLFLYKAGWFIWSGLPSKYTVFNCSLSASSFSTSSKLLSLQLLAHRSSRLTNCFKLWRCERGTVLPGSPVGRDQWSRWGDWIVPKGSWGWRECRGLWSRLFCFFLARVPQGLSRYLG